MGVRLILCSQYANKSEEQAAQTLFHKLQSKALAGTWTLLVGYQSSSGAGRLSDDLDQVVVAPTGLWIIEVKHWSMSDVRRGALTAADSEADKLNAKVRRLVGRLRDRHIDPGFVKGRFLFTRNEADRGGSAEGRLSVRGVPVYGLREWKDLVEVDGPESLADVECKRILSVLLPGEQPAIEDRIRSFHHFIDLQLQSVSEDGFHRTFTGRRIPGRERVVVHLYDTTARSRRGDSSQTLARREFEAFQKLQKAPWLPGIMDSFQEASLYPGELYFFSHADPEAATLAERARDRGWGVVARVETAVACCEALDQLHRGVYASDGSPTLHRDLSPERIRVRTGGAVILTHLQMSRLDGQSTITSQESRDAVDECAAPEVRQSGRAAATAASDVYALCTSLRVLFEGRQECPTAAQALEVLQGGMKPSAADRPTAEDLSKSLRVLVSTAPTPPARRPPVAFWDEDTDLRFHDRRYRILARLGSGSVGTAFKVLEVSRDNTEEISGPYVAKVITDPETGVRAARAYARVRAQTGSAHLAAVHEVASEWSPHEIAVLMRWIDGDSLGDLAGLLELYFEELGLPLDEEALLGWVRQLCCGLAELHRSRLVHGDVSPRNIIASRGELVLVDYDGAGPAGCPPLARTLHYCSPEVQDGTVVEPSDDIYALAASLDAVLNDRMPFQYDDGLHKKRGRRREPGAAGPLPAFEAFLDRATNPDRSSRFTSADDVLAFLQRKGEGATFEAMPARTEGRVQWLSLLLQSYPGSPKGNAETRGVDSDFALRTYVESGLDQLLLDDIRGRRVQLVVLCGNAGDGKTSILQMLAQRLAAERPQSAEHTWVHWLPDGLEVRVNLDGSAAGDGRSAEELLNDFFAPFRTRDFPANRAHMLAINDGPLVQWLECSSGAGYVQDQLHRALGRVWGEPQELDPRIRFIHLNQRSLVGGIETGAAGVLSGFLDSLLGRLLAVEEGHWRPCCTCTAQDRCHAWASVQALRHAERGADVRKRLARALQAVHLGGEVHITARSLRSTLVYGFFGTHDCDDLHRDPTLRPARYHDLFFDSATDHRQGDLLKALERLDPALESHPRVDRALLREAASGDGQPLSQRLGSARRLAYFEWGDGKQVEVAGKVRAIDLANGRYLDDFLRVATGGDGDRQALCSDLCDGIARLETLPAGAYVDASVVPLKIAQRTPTETAFWVVKPKDHFALRARLAPGEGVERLHTHVELVYTFAGGHRETLVMGAGLFDLLMRVKGGLQLSNTLSDDVFSQLSVFKQRLAQEDDTELYACNPADERCYRLHASLEDGVRRLCFNALASGGGS